MKLFKRKIKYTILNLFLSSRCDTTLLHKFFGPLMSLSVRRQSLMLTVWYCSLTLRTKKESLPLLTLKKTGTFRNRASQHSYEKAKCDSATTGSSQKFKTPIYSSCCWNLVLFPFYRHASCLQEVPIKSRCLDKEPCI